MPSQTELDNLAVMYEGDKNRDASSTIRGFLFQDYVTIMCILDNQVECVFSEYLEDIDVFFEDGKTFKFIQVKHYPKTVPNMKEISTDLYYQYLRLKMLRSGLEPIPCLSIHGNSTVAKPTLDEMKTYIGLGEQLKASVTPLNTKESKDWLKTHVYISGKKDNQKKTLFAEWASEQSLSEFLSKYEISNESNINQYKESLMEKLASAYPNPDKNGDKENWRLILLGLAVLYIHRRYSPGNSDFNQLKIDKNGFSQYILQSIQTRTEQTIASYLVAIVCQKYAEIIQRNDLSDVQEHMLNLICRNTVQWINEIGMTPNGQYQLLNTCSSEEAKTLSSYKKSDVNARLIAMAETKSGFLVFLEYLWKIMLNICQDAVDSEGIPSDNSELFHPTTYMVGNVKEYICLNFPQDKYVNRSVILPPAGGAFKGLKRKIIERMITMDPPKPGKWFFKTSSLLKGKNYYDYSTANVSENPTVLDLGKNCFYIECMDCINIDENEWGTHEDCGACIFSEKCIKEGESV